jgi:protein SCO1/2
MQFNVKRLIETTLRGLLGLLLAVPAAWAAPELPNDSVYHVASNWVNQNGSKVNIADFQGKVQVVAFVYTYCEHSCPFIIANLKRIEREIPAETKADVQFSLVSLDPARDSPEVLKQYMLDHDLDEQLWTMLNGNPDDVLELSALLGVRYRPMDNEAKDIAHSNMITVLDRQGRIHYQMKGLNEGLEAVVSAIMRTTKADN